MTRKLGLLPVARQFHLVVVGGDEPQLQVQVVVPLLHADEVEDVVVLHAAHAVDLVLVLPGQLVLHESRQTFFSGAGREGGADIWSACSSWKQPDVSNTWMGKIFTATYSFSSWAFHTHPKRPLAFTSISCSGLCPRMGDGGEGPGSCGQRAEEEH